MGSRDKKSLCNVIEVIKLSNLKAELLESFKPAFPKNVEVD